MWDLIPVSRWIPLGIVSLVACQRVVELVISEGHRKNLLARGGFEVGAGHYPYMVAIHISWMMALMGWVELTSPNISLGLIIGYALTQVLRAWVMIALGTFWTTRIITVPGAPLVARGPYRFMRHPNYLVVTAEIALLPLAFGAWQIALVFTVLNAVILWIRISAENAVLALRRDPRL